MALKSPSPVLRGIATLIALYGAFASRSFWLFAVAFGVVFTTLLIQGKLSSFARFCFAVVLPVGIGLVFIWGFVRQGTPDISAKLSIQAGVLYATITTLRLALLGGIFQCAFLSLSVPKLVHQLQSFGVRGRMLAIVVSTLNLWPDFRRHVEQIIAARCARGLMPDRRLLTRLRQAPLVIRTLFISGLGHGLDRADAWEAGGLIAKLGQLGEQASITGNYSRMVGVAWIFAAVAWVTAATFCSR